MRRHDKTYCFVKGQDLNAGAPWKHINAPVQCSVSEQKVEKKTAQEEVDHCLSEIFWSVENFSNYRKCQQVLWQKTIYSWRNLIKISWKGPLVRSGSTTLNIMRNDFENWSKLFSPKWSAQSTRADFVFCELQVSSKEAPEMKLFRILDKCELSGNYLILPMDSRYIIKENILFVDSTLKTNWRQPVVQLSRNLAHSRSAMSKLNIFRSSWNPHNQNADLAKVIKYGWNEEITGCISSCRFFRFSSTNSYSLVLSTNQLLGKLNFFFGKIKLWKNLKLSWIRWWFTWRSGEQLVSGASSGPPWNI